MSTAGQTAGQQVLTAEPRTFAEALAVLEACAEPADRYVKVAGSLSAVVEVVARHGDDDTARYMLRRALAWIAAEAQVSAQATAVSDRDFYGRDVDVEPPRRVGGFVIAPEDIGGYALGRWA